MLDQHLRMSWQQLWVDIEELFEDVLYNEVVFVADVCFYEVEELEVLLLVEFIEVPDLRGLEVDGGKGFYLVEGDL